MTSKPKGDAMPDRFTLTLSFHSDDDRDHFIGWFLDGGGEYQFGESCEVHDKRRLSPDPPNGRDWEWMNPRPGDADPMEPSTPLETPLANYTIDMTPVEDV